MMALTVALAVVTSCAWCGTHAAGHASPVRTGNSPTDGTGPGPAWIVTTGSLPRLEAAGLPGPVLSADFDNPDTLLLGRGRVDKFVPHASPAVVFTSEVARADALSAGRVPAAVTWILLDLEHWPLTPADEQADPVAALRKVTALAHSRGKKVLFTPAVDLLSVLAPGTPGSARFATFDRLVVGPGAAAADGFEVQSQQTEATPSAATFVSAAIATARAAHPGAPVLAGLSTNPDGRRVTAADLMAVYLAARSAGATGFWLNIPETSAECPRCGIPQAPVAVTFLRALGPTPAITRAYRAAEVRRGGRQRGPVRPRSRGSRSFCRSISGRPSRPVAVR